jgi:hypothetical protein
MPGFLKPIEGSNTKRVFVSAADEDFPRVSLLCGQAKKQNGWIEFSECPTKVAYDTLAAEQLRQRIRDQIRNSAVTVCLIGATTHASKWVDWEIRESIRKGNRLIGVRLDRSAVSHRIPSPLLFHPAPILDWNIAAIVRAIG